LAKPYTRTGDIVIAANPYQWLTHLYKEEVQLEYAQKLVWQPGDGDNRKVLEPHIYETSAMSYKGLAYQDMPQSILVSGESGAGVYIPLCFGAAYVQSQLVVTHFQLGAFQHR